MGIKVLFAEELKAWFVMGVKCELHKSYTGVTWDLPRLLPKAPEGWIVT